MAQRRPPRREAAGEVVGPELPQLLPQAARLARGQALKGLQGDVGVGVGCLEP